MADANQLVAALRLIAGRKDPRLDWRIAAEALAAFEAQAAEPVEAEVDSLTACLKAANNQVEHYEREWCMRGDVIELQEAKIDALQEDLTAALQAKAAESSQEPVAWIDNSGHPHHLSYVQGHQERRLYGPLRPLYAAPVAQAEPAWLPIETAPKDREILVWFSDLFKGMADVAKWEPDTYAKKPRPYWQGSKERMLGILAYRHGNPTHWMPLPQPPKENPNG